MNYRFDFLKSSKMMLMVSGILVAVSILVVAVPVAGGIKFTLWP